MKTFKLLVVFLLLCALTASAFAQKMKPEEVIAKHLESIGTAEARASVKNQMAVGDVQVTFVSQKNQTAVGRVVMVSEGTKNFLGMNLNAVDYPLEKLSYDGKDAKVAFVRTNVRSILGNFILSNQLMLEESLLGGTLSTSWALSNIAVNKAKVSLDGTKKINGKEVYVLRYTPKGGSDIDITLYFEKDTFRHVRTEYKRTSSAGIGTRPEQSSGMSETRLKITENFGDFKTEKNLTLPHSYSLNYLTTGLTVEIEWKFELTQFAFNQALDAKTFDAETK